MSENPKPNIQNPALIKTTLPFWRQLRWNLILYFVLLAVLPVVIAVFITLNRTNAQAREQVVNQLESIAELKSDEISRWLDDSELAISFFLSVPIYNRLLALAASPSPDKEEQDILNSILREAVNTRNPDLEDSLHFLELFVYNAEGQVIAASNPAQIDKVVTRQPYFAKSLAGNYIQPPYYAIGSAELTMLVTHLLVDQSGQTIGVLVARLDMSSLGRLMTERTGLSESGETYLVSLENNYLVTPSRFESEGYILTRAYHSEGIDLALNRENGSGTYLNYRDPPVPVIGVYRWIPELDAGLVAELEEAEALSAFEQSRNFSIGVAAMAALLAVLVGFYSATRISRPIAMLTQVASRITGGDLDQRVEIVERNEMGVLATAFNTMTGQLQELISSLEERVAARTHRLEIAASLGERLSAILNLEELLAEVVNRVKESFNYYHAHIYLLDDKRERLVMVEGAGEAGAKMKAQGHSIPLAASTSLVARAARTGRIVRVDNVREAMDWLPNPLLPNTYSEMAVPIILEGQVVGVLDVQQDKIGSLDEGDENLLRSVANQVAVAIRNARLFDEVQSALTEAQTLQQRFLEQAWDRTKVARRSIGRVQFSLGESKTLDETMTAEARRQALTYKEPTLVTLNGSQLESEKVKAPSSQGVIAQESNTGESTQVPSHASPNTHHALVTPIMLRQTPIGNLQLHDIDPEREWSEGELTLITAVIDQVAQIAENLRLLDESQERASREQLVSQVSDKLRRASDIETLMKIAVAELSQVLNPARTFVRFGPVTTLEVVQSDDSEHPDQEETLAEFTEPEAHITNQ